VDELALLLDDELLVLPSLVEPPQPTNIKPLIMTAPIPMENSFAEVMVSVPSS
jgi:hypothetical protein